MSENLKTLYTRLVTNQLHEVSHWHSAFTQTVDRVAAFSNKLANREIDPVEDEKDLNWLLFEANNGVSSKGNSVLQKGMKASLTQDLDFLKSLRNFLCSPGKVNFERFRDAWILIAERNHKNKNPVLWNRVAAARTREVSTTVDQTKFNQIFYWLQKKDLIADYTGEDSWYAKNVYIIQQFREVFKDELVDGADNDATDEYYLSMFVWYLYENIGNHFSLKKQLVKYGPPGTGKTYLAHQEAQQAFDLWQCSFDNTGHFKFEDHYRLVQFHPSISYEDFIEGMRPQLVDGQAQLTLQNGVFKTFCRKAAQWEIDLHTLIEKNQTLANLTVSDVYKLKETAPEVFKGAHWDYIWELDPENLDEIPLEDALPPYFFVIDEINRAELSRVFGELMICLEYRGSKGLGLIQTQYTGLNDKTTGMIRHGDSHHFFVPHNLYLLGTMNSIDRSVESFDFALRRRFRWELVLPDPGLVSYHWEQKHKDWRGLGECLAALNKMISNHEHLGEDYQIGHAYLMNLRYPDHLSLTEVKKRIWGDSLSPLLHEYLRGTSNEADKDLEALGKAFGVK